MTGGSIGWQNSGGTTIADGAGQRAALEVGGGGEGGGGAGRVERKSAPKFRSRSRASSACLHRPNDTLHFGTKPISAPLPLAAVDAAAA